MVDMRKKKVLQFEGTDSGNEWCWWYCLMFSNLKILFEA